MKKEEITQAFIDEIQELVSKKCKEVVIFDSIGFVEHKYFEVAGESNHLIYYLYNKKLNRYQQATYNVEINNIDIRLHSVYCKKENGEKVLDPRC